MNLCSGRNIIECTFGRLKARFGAIMTMNTTIDDLPFVIYSCFVLHNFCKMNSESISEDSVRSNMIYE